MFFVAPSDVQAGQGAVSTIRVGRNCSCKSCGAIESMSLETYVKRVLPHEWYSTWHAESLKAGSVAARSFAAWYVYNPISTTFDICDSTCCQVYNTAQYASTDAAVNATAGWYFANIYGNIARCEYSAEANNSGCGDGKTNSCISDSPCAGATNNGHGRGMCQWGSKRWADQGKSYTWILQHYYNFNNYFLVYLTGSTTAKATKVQDNTGTGFTASTNWIASTGSVDKYGADYKYRSTAATTDEAVWTVSLGYTGNYEVSAFWSAGANRSAAAPFVLPNGTVVNKNQQANGGLWQVLGTVNCASGSRTVKLGCNAPTGYVVVADAVKFYGPL